MQASTAPQNYGIGVLRTGSFSPFLCLKLASAKAGLIFPLLYPKKLGGRNDSPRLPALIPYNQDLRAEPSLSSSISLTWESPRASDSSIFQTETPTSLLSSVQN